MKLNKVLGLIMGCVLPVTALCSSYPSLTISSGDPSYKLFPGQSLSASNPLFLAQGEQTTLPLGISDNPTDLSDAAVYPHLNLPTEPDWDGLMADSKLFLIYQVAVVGVIYFMPESTSQWTEEDKKGNIFSKWDDNVNNLRKDKDDWAINYIGHPYFGSVYYVRARQRGFDRPGSLWYAITMSTIYEYGIEALFEPVSIQDLIFTPVGGAIIGEYFMIAREKIMKRVAAQGYTSTSDKVKLFFTDPLGVVNEKVNSLFGLKESRLDLYPMLGHNQATHVITPSLVGLQAHLRW